MESSSVRAVVDRANRSTLQRSLKLHIEELLKIFCQLYLFIQFSRGCQRDLADVRHATAEEKRTVALEQVT